MFSPAASFHNTHTASDFVIIPQSSVSAKPPPAPAPGEDCKTVNHGPRLARHDYLQGKASERATDTSPSPPRCLFSGWLVRKRETTSTSCIIETSGGTQVRNPGIRLLFKAPEMADT